MPIDYFYYIKNIWSRAISKNYMKVKLAEDLKEIDYYLRTDIEMDSIIRLVHKLFCLQNNYPKGNGDLLKSHIEEYYSEQLLRYAERMNSNRQDILTICDGPIYFNTRFYMEYLDIKLAAHGKTNILEEIYFTRKY